MNSNINQIPRECEWINDNDQIFYKWNIYIFKFNFIMKIYYIYWKNY